MLKKTDQSFFIPYLIFLIVGGLMMLLFTQKEIFFWVNNHFSISIDPFAEPITDLGDGMTCTIIGILLMLFVKVRHGWSFLVACALEGIIVQVLKIYVFLDKPRPWAFYKATEHIHLVKNFTPYSNNSFPSGHTASAFCMAAMLTLIWPKAKTGWLLLLIACIIGYSRIYLSQHYFMDVYGGSIIGVISALAAWYFFYGPNQKKFSRLHKIDQPIISFRKKRD